MNYILPTSHKYLSSIYRSVFNTYFLSTSRKYFFPLIYKNMKRQAATLVYSEKPAKIKRVKANGELHKGDALIARGNDASSSEPDFSYDPAFLSEDEQKEIIDELSKLPWQKVTYTKFGKPRSTPRHTFCFGTPSATGASVDVSYMGSHYMTEAIPPWLATLKAKVEKETGFEYNAIILNNYTTEGEYISWHTDDERFLQHTTVGSISLGASRTFKVRTSPLGAICKLKSKPKAEKGEPDPMAGTKETAVKLISGSLSVLYHGIEHSLPKETPTPHKGMKNRYNITFRCLKPFREGEKMSGWGNYYHYNRGSVYKTNK